MQTSLEKQSNSCLRMQGDYAGKVHQMQTQTTANKVLGSKFIFSGTQTRSLIFFILERAGSTMLGRVSTFLQRCSLPAFHRCWLHDSLFQVHPSVSEALAENKPVVALESTIITHGMPYPQNLSTAQEVEAIVRAHGATPATVGVLRGRVHVGLSQEQLHFLSCSRASLKVSRRDVPYAVSKGLSGGTTVSGTMIAAHRASIPVFVTGGIGGVHRDGENSMDVSADLTELGRTPVAVVSAGVKSILDIGRTLEFLETQGVCVATFGKSRDFPAFFSPQSGFTSPYNVTDAEEAAELIEAMLTLGLQSGVLLAVPIPEEHAAAGQLTQEAIRAAVAEASEKGIRGRDVTPFILQRVSELTQGQSLQANMALIRNNARVGSQIARALSELRRRKRSESPPPRGEKTPPPRKEKTPPTPTKAVVIGGINVDFVAKGKTEKLLFGQTNPGSVCQAYGGVGRNIADCLTRLGERPLLISAVGADSQGDIVLSHCGHMNTCGIARMREQRTATYCVVITGSGELSLGLGDMDIHQRITAQYVAQFEEQLSSASLVCVDGNIPVATIDYVCSLSRKHALPVWYEPTDTDKASKPFMSDSWKNLSYTSPNLAELCAMNRALGLSTPAVLPSDPDEVLDCAATLSRPLLEHLQCVVVTLGPLGVLVCGEHEDGMVRLAPRRNGRTGRLCAVHYPAIPLNPADIVNVSGAGDSLAGGLMAGVLRGLRTDDSVRLGLLAARRSLASRHPVAPSLSSDTVNLARVRSQAWPRPSCRWMEELGQ
ncbi:pseudouridine-metabolizing bifunctional protein C1861.05 isoform X2 [Anguilla anguilla]|uniref:pseudouridine-metabolizing bifunctional protein C1861.05 isoform X2 n=1 Tax=Anguilla anguilla TaxID=7936 RepID=UPI0015B37400|nr:pseudouridine-metabolizing bifunctional protein C1861.05 isoform X2 [Anguilla anguilla]